jgi:hypothetical protein
LKRTRTPRRTLKFTFKGKDLWGDPDQVGSARYRKTSRRVGRAGMKSKRRDWVAWKLLVH